MQIRKITHSVLEDFPELKEQGFNNHDMFLVWKSYFTDVQQNMLYPKDLYIKFLDLGVFYVTHNKIIKRKEVVTRKRNFKIISETKINGLIQLCYRKIEFYNALILYLEGYSEKADKDIKGYKSLIRGTENILEELKLFKDEYYKESTPRDLEKQSSDSRGNQEQDIQEGAY